MAMLLCNIWYCTVGCVVPMAAMPLRSGSCTAVPFLVLIWAMLVPGKATSRPAPRKDADLRLGLWVLEPRRTIIARLVLTRGYGSMRIVMGRVVLTQGNGAMRNLVLMRGYGATSAHDRGVPELQVALLLLHRSALA
eukprot:2997183-Rhodomonas_salina.1